MQWFSGRFAGRCISGMASKRKRRHAEQSEARAQASGLYSKGTGRNACRYLGQRPTTRKALVVATCLNGIEEDKDGAQDLPANRSGRQDAGGTFLSLPGATTHDEESARRGYLFGIFRIFRIFGIFGIMLLLPEFPRGKIGPEGVCEAYEGRRGGGKSFFAKRTKKSL